MSICKNCFHSYVCEQFNEHRECDNEKCHFFNDHFVPAKDVIRVVRCKDCEHCCISTDPKTNISIQKCGYVGFNPVQSSQVSDDFYCGYGELKEREG